MNNILFENERQLNIPCVNTLCDYQGDARFDACCCQELANGDPSHSTCKLYLPTKLSTNCDLKHINEFPEQPCPFTVD
jgi:hypothetical protein